MPRRIQAAEFPLTGKLSRYYAARICQAMHSWDKNPIKKLSVLTQGMARV
jgi:hypothetical protein